MPRVYKRFGKASFWGLFWTRVDLALISSRTSVKSANNPQTDDRTESARPELRALAVYELKITSQLISRAYFLVVWYLENQGDAKQVGPTSAICESSTRSYRLRVFFVSWATFYSFFFLYQSDKVKLD